jgi:hypothetical protein
VHGAKAEFGGGCPIGRKLPVSEHVLDNDRTSVPYRPAAGCSVPSPDAGKAANELFVEAAVRRDGEVPEPPVHQLDVSASGAVDLQAPGQGDIQHRPKVATFFDLCGYNIL